MTYGFLIVKISYAENVTPNSEGKMQLTGFHCEPYYTLLSLLDDSRYEETKEEILGNGEMFYGGIKGITEEEFKKTDGKRLIELLNKLNQDDSEIDVESELEKIFKS